MDRLLRDYQDPTGSPARRALAKRCRELKEHIAIIYQRFLDKADSRASNVEVTVNGEPVLPWDPFQKSLSELVADETVEVEGTGAKFHVRAYILPRARSFRMTNWRERLGFRRTCRACTSIGNSA